MQGLCLGVRTARPSAAQPRRKSRGVPAERLAERLAPGPPATAAERVAYPARRQLDLARQVPPGNTLTEPAAPRCQRCHLHRATPHDSGGGGSGSSSGSGGRSQV